MTRTLRSPLAGILLAALAVNLGCQEEAYKEPSRRVAMFELTLNGTEVGSEESPLPFPSGAPASANLTIRALDAKGDLFPYNGAARVSVVPGVVDGTSNRVQFTNGEASASIQWRFSFGQTKIWIEDSGEDPATECADGVDNDRDGLTDTDDPDCDWRLADDNYYEGITATGATGISEPLYFESPKIRDVQYSPQCTTDSPLAGENATISQGTLIVTGTSQSGLYVTDLDGFENGYHSVYLYTYSNPDGVVRGDRLCSISGNVIEFIGNTQFNYPDYLVADFDHNGVLNEYDFALTCQLENSDIIGPGAVPPPVQLNSTHLAGSRFGCTSNANCTDGKTCQFVQGCENDACIITACLDGPASSMGQDCKKASDCGPGYECILGECIKKDIPETFYEYCGTNNAALGLEDPTDCNEAYKLLKGETERKIDCNRDNFAMEPWEHALVSFSNVAISDLFVYCDFNGDGNTNWQGSEGKCVEACDEDPRCTTLSNLQGYNQFGVGIDCVSTTEGIQCLDKISVSYGDTIGNSGYNPRTPGVCIKSERIQGCSEANPCKDNFACIDGICATNYGTCETANDCAEFKVDCVQGHCVNQNSLSELALNDKNCNSTHPCPNGMACIDQECIALGATCTQKGDCAEGYDCIDGMCLSAEQETGMCTTGSCTDSLSSCYNGKCYRPGNKCSTERKEIPDWVQTYVKENEGKDLKYPIVEEPAQCDEGFICFGAAAGKTFSSIQGHLRHLQPGPGIESEWVIEPRFIEDFGSETGKVAKQTETGEVTP